MTELVQLVQAIGEDDLAAYVTGRRWFGSKSREVAGARILEATVARNEAPALVLALVEIRFLPGTHEIYQVPFGLRPRGEHWEESVVAELEGWTAYDAMADPDLARELVRLIGSGATLGSGGSTFHKELSFRAQRGICFCWCRPGRPRPGRPSNARQRWIHRAEAL